MLRHIEPSARWMCLAAVIALPAMQAQAVGAAEKAEQTRGVSTEKLTSSGGITTEVRREVISEMTEGDLEQASLLSSHLLQHFADARQSIAAGDHKHAIRDLRRATELVGVIRRILPVTNVSVIVTDKNGMKLYEDVRDVQPDEVPLMHVVSAVDFLEPVIEAHKKEAEVSGVKLTHRDYLHARMGMNLRLVETRLRSAAHLASDGNDEQAGKVLAGLMRDAVNIQFERLEAPLAEVREALVYAHRAMNSHNYAEARANLVTAREHLALYRDTLPETDHDEIETLAKEIQSIEKQIERPNAATAGQARERISDVFQRLMKRPTTAKPGSQTAGSEAPTAAPRKSAESRR